jgi:CelD/BcsL family acetyltransferase involved in cellulose biosynthesis
VTPELVSDPIAVHVREAMAETETSARTTRGARPEPWRWALQVVRDPAEVGAEWRLLQSLANVSPYQRLDYIAAWLGQGAREERMEACIGLVRDWQGEPAMLLPFGIRKGALGRIAHYLGGTHVNLNMPLVAPGFRKRLSPAMVQEILSAYCRSAGVDTLALAHQPVAWQGEKHPLLCLPHISSAQGVERLVCRDPDNVVSNILSTSARAKLRRKENRFRDAGAQVLEARTDSDIRALIDVFMAQKAQRLAAKGEKNLFLAEGVSAFLREAALSAARDEDGFRLFALMIDQHPIAVRGVLRHRNHVSFVLQSFDTQHGLAKLSAGEVLLARVVEAEVASGVTEFDFGLGETGYKRTWSNARIDMFDINLPVTARGRLQTAALAASRTAVGALKRNPRLYQALKRSRAWLFRQRHNQP